MNKLLKINANGLVVEFLERYKIWQDHRNFYKDPAHAVAEISHDGIPCFYYRDIKNINSSSSPLIAIDCLTEGLHSKEFFERYNKNKKYILFCNGTWDTSYHHIDIDYVLVQSHFVLYLAADVYNSPNRFGYYIDKNYDFEGSKPYSFVSTIGNVRKERTIVVDKLTQSLAHRKFILRYSGVDHGLPGNHLDVINFELGKFDPYTSILEKYHHNVSQSLPITMYNAANFNLVVETDLDYQHSFFLTEKTIKVLATGMPFVSVSTPEFLTNIRSLGFETYHSLWDESYDQETDYFKRIDMIVDLCNNLCDFDWAANRDQLQSIKYKNQANFLNLNTVIDQEYRQFEKIIQQIL
jgi:hypothetical protein